MSHKKKRHRIADAINPVRHAKVMGRLVRRRMKKPGLPPGTMVHTGVQKVDRVRITYLDFDLEHASESEVDSVDACFPFKSSPTVSWVNVDGLHDVELVRSLGEHFGWHPLLMEDVVGTGQRAKVEEYEDYLFVVLPMLSWNAEHNQVEQEQLSMVLGDRYVFTFQERVGDVFDPIRERIRNAKGRVRTRGADYLAYTLMDAVVDSCFQVLEAIGDRTEVLEEALLADSDQNTMIQLHALKRELIAVRRAVWPMRDALAQVVRDEEDMFTPETEVFLRDVHDHAVQVVESVEVLRDVVSGAVDLNLSRMTMRTNEVMKVLTIMASIFIPLTFVVGIYGMNFDYLPELRIRWAYPVLMLTMASLAGGMVYYFRKKGWL
ncbi:MAG TPA: magnesium/cobalt transporter CorA [Longimicrobiales bacterium]|nr:magnesium/cobalt transporter CorA [Longimicrobiales bacterium]